MPDRGLRLVERNGKALAEEAFEKMIDKQPQLEESWVPPVRSAGTGDDSILPSLR